MEIEWKENHKWYGPGAYLFYKVNERNKLEIDIICRLTDDDKIIGYRSQIKITIDNSQNIFYIYDNDLEISKLKSLIKARDLGLEIKDIKVK